MMARDFHDVDRSEKHPRAKSALGLLQLQESVAAMAFALKAEAMLEELATFKNSTPIDIESRGESEWKSLRSGMLCVLPKRQLCGNRLAGKRRETFNKQAMRGH